MKIVGIAGAILGLFFCIVLGLFIYCAIKINRDR